jgi:large subunit ribosomal protein L3
MPTALLGKKLGMTRVFDEKGAMRPVTVIEAGPCAVLQVKTPEKEGYRALQLGFGERFTGEQWDRITKKAAEGKLRGNLKGLQRPMMGHLKETAKGASPKRFVKEVPYLDGETFEAGQTVGCDIVEAWKHVDVVGTSKGRGYAGTIKAHNFNRGRASHGSKNTRRPGSVGQKTFPGRTHPGKRLYKHLGDARCTVRNLAVVKVDKEKNLVLLEGAVPGPTGAFVLVRKARAMRVAKVQETSGKKAKK